MVLFLSFSTGEGGERVQKDLTSVDPLVDDELRKKDNSKGGESKKRGR